MARLSTSRAIRLAVSLALIAFALASLANCKQSLSIRDAIVAAVDSESDGPRLSLYDGSVEIPKDGTATWPNTIISSSAAKTLTIKNTGHENLDLKNVAIAGSSTSFGSIVQPVSTTLAPGNTIDFSVTFTPPGADTDYSASFVINSNDSANPSFGFKGAGHSTQWHGFINNNISVGEGSASDTHVAVEGQTVYWSYKPGNGNVTLYTSQNGGRSTNGGYNHTAHQGNDYSTLAIYNGVPHQFWLHNSGTPTLYYGNCPSGTWHDISGDAATIDTSNFQLEGDLIIAQSRAYMVWYDSNTHYLSGRRTTSDFSYYQETDLVHCYNDGAGLGGRYPSIRYDGNGRYYVLCASEDRKTVNLEKLKADLTLATEPGESAFHTVSTFTGSDTVTDCALVIVGTGASAVLHALWKSTRGAPQSSIWYSRASASNLNSWKPPSNFDPENDRCGVSLSFVADGSGNLMFLHVGSTGGLHIIRSTDGGESWTHGVVDASNWNPLANSSLSLAAQGSSVYAAYTKQLADLSYQVILAKSVDGGVTW